MGKLIRKATSKIKQANIEMAIRFRKNSKLTKIAMESKGLLKKGCSMTKDTRLSRKKEVMMSNKPTITTISKKMKPLNSTNLGKASIRNSNLQISTTAI